MPRLQPVEDLDTKGTDMTSTIPRAEVNAVARCHGVDYDLAFDPPVEWVRDTAAALRSDGPFGPPSREVQAEAADLDALADRYEKETT